MDLGLKGKGAVVLASSAGLGFAVAEALLEEGARVAISGRDEARLKSALERLQPRFGGDMYGERLDVTDTPALVRHLEGAKERWGALHVLVVNAGGPPYGKAEELDEALLDKAYALSLKSGVMAVRTVLPWMRAQRWGRIIAITSSSTRQPIPNLALSNIMRPGITGYLKTLSTEVAADNVLVNSICTGTFTTDRLMSTIKDRAARNGVSFEDEKRKLEQDLPTRRLGDPREFGALAAFMASEKASFLNGVALPLDGGAGRGLY